MAVVQNSSWSLLTITSATGYARKNSFRISRGKLRGNAHFCSALFEIRGAFGVRVELLVSEVAVANMVVFVADEHVTLPDSVENWIRNVETTTGIEGLRLLALFSTSHRDNNRVTPVQWRLHLHRAAGEIRRAFSPRRRAAAVEEDCRPDPHTRCAIGA